LIGLEIPGDNQFYHSFMINVFIFLTCNQALFIHYSYTGRFKDKEYETFMIGWGYSFSG